MYALSSANQINFRINLIYILENKKKNNNFMWIPLFSLIYILCKAQFSAELYVEI